MRILLNNIPCIVFSPSKEDTNTPTVFLYHGWSSCKDNHSFTGEILSKFGYRVIIPDSIHHGERGSLDYDDFNIGEEYFFETIFNSIDEFPKILKGVQDKFNINTEKMAVMGHSMGGFISSGIFAEHKKIKTMICFNGGTSYEKAVEELSKPDKDYKISKEDDYKIKKYDPLAKLVKQDDLRPIFILHGASDEIVPISIQKYFYEKVSPLYKKSPQILKFDEIPRLNHYVTIGMLKSSIEWMNLYV
ncbi:alpha/beta fold hydrolase [Clostridium sp. JN-1]|uniref:alpha/beta fold hydrolase n=1 Tax=Clostridium sp. JN-1 TaxID=2483110 RepID=UPI001681B7A0|nr:alpha/beta fold hydrolase [Clostridium sp. JN-1]